MKKSTKTILLVITPILIIAILSVFYYFFLSDKSSQPKIGTIDICGDLIIHNEDPCDHPKVYLVNNEKECKNVGGRWADWMGAWSKGTACFVE
jgi:flagellar basal body-associated protein FliL